MTDVQRAAIRAAEANTKWLVDRLVDGDRVDMELRNEYTIEKIEKLARVYGGRL